MRSRASLERQRLAIDALQHLDHVVAVAGLHGQAGEPGLEHEQLAIELRHGVAAFDPAQVTALVARRAGRVAHRELDEAIRLGAQGADQFLAGLLRAPARGDVGGRRGQQDVADPDRVGVVQARAVGLEVLEQGGGVGGRQRHFGIDQRAHPGFVLGLAVERFHGQLQALAFAPHQFADDQGGRRGLARIVRIVGAVELHLAGRSRPRRSGCRRPSRTPVPARPAAGWGHRHGRGMRPWPRRPTTPRHPSRSGLHDWRLRDWSTWLSAPGTAADAGACGPPGRDGVR
jgi:hypothetical protein